jgi:hypothetical protein
LQPASTRFLLGLFFDPKDGDNIRPSANYMVLQPFFTVITMRTSSPKKINHLLDLNIG